MIADTRYTPTQVGMPPNRFSGGIMVTEYRVRGIRVKIVLGSGFWKLV